ncbi:retron system putative HNH endonuclease [Viridibacillus arvi]|uniref:retron system putative HNH endonuclease n=1 Tax=Viridibacillus arvi TaxID=263475 RepID=UPI003CFC8C76
MESKRLQSSKRRLKEYLIEAEGNLRNIESYGETASYKRFNFASIKMLDSELYEKLLANFNHQCAYCENSFDTAYIENYRPKTLYPQLAYDWNNLLPVCRACSITRRDIFPIDGLSSQNRLQIDISNEKPLLLNPTIDEPEKHLQFSENGKVMAKTRRGNETIEVLNLNREVLVKKRVKYYDVLSKNKKNTLSESEFQVFDLIDHSAVLRTFIVNEYSLRELLELSVAKRTQLLCHLRLNPKMSDEEFAEIYEAYRYKQKDIMLEVVPSSNQPQYIKGFNVKNLSQLNFEYTFQFGEKTPWLMILGENGTGKTTLLQSLVVSATRQVKKTKGFSSRLENGSLSVTFGTLEDEETIHNVNFKLDGSDYKLKHNIPIAAYGSTRLIDTDRVEKSIPAFQNVRNLFPISNTAYFLPKLSDWAKKEDILQIQDALVEILPTNSDKSVYLTFNDEQKQFLVTFNAETYYRFDELSSGYRTIVSLVVDIMRFLLSQPNHKGRFTSAIVLIDEIDVHLHPSWKIKIVDLFRKTFPYVQFIMTTHDPLCLRGLEPNEIMILKKQWKEEKTLVLKENIPFQGDLKIEQLLLSDFFGLDSTLDPIHQEQLHAEYETTEKMKYTYYGYSSAEKMALQIIDRAIEDKRINFNDNVEDIDLDIKQAVLRLWGLDD